MSEISPSRIASQSRKQLCRDRLQVADERGELGFAVVGAKDRGRVDGGDTSGARGDATGSPRSLRDPELPTEQRLRRGGAEADEHARLHDGELRFEPGTAGGNLGRVRLLVDAPLARAAPI